MPLRHREGADRADDDERLADLVAEPVDGSVTLVVSACAARGLTVLSTISATIDAAMAAPMLMSSVATYGVSRSGASPARRTSVNTYQL